MPTHSDLKAAENAQLIKQLALELGFSFCGISKAEFLQEEAPRLEAWLNKSMHGEMSYMENHFDMRLDPRLLVPGAKSVVSCLSQNFEVCLGRRLSLCCEGQAEVAHAAADRTNRRYRRSRVC